MDQGVYAADENWPLDDIGGGGYWWDEFRQASWDDAAKIVKKSWWETRFKAYWGWPAEPQVTGTPPLTTGPGPRLTFAGDSS